MGRKDKQPNKYTDRPLDRLIQHILCIRGEEEVADPMPMPIEKPGGAKVVGFVRKVKKDDPKPPPEEMDTSNEDKDGAEPGERYFDGPGPSPGPVYGPVPQPSVEKDEGFEEMDNSANWAPKPPPFPKASHADREVMQNSVVNGAYCPIPAKMRRF